jgi:hypothetical protein
VAKKVNQHRLYKQAAARVGVSVPKSDMRSSKMIDGVVWDGKDPKKYAASLQGQGLGERMTTLAIDKLMSTVRLLSARCRPVRHRRWQ